MCNLLLRQILYGILVITHDQNEIYVKLHLLRRKELSILFGLDETPTFIIDYVHIVHTM